MLYVYVILRSFAHSVLLATTNPALFPTSVVSQATKGGTPALVSPPLAIQIVVLTRARWPLGKQTRELAHGIISARIQIVVLHHERWPLEADKWWNSRTVLFRQATQIVVLIRECRP